jgi:hypothetical protein
VFKQGLLHGSSQHSRRHSRKRSCLPLPPQPKRRARAGATHGYRCNGLSDRRAKVELRGYPAKHYSLRMEVSYVTWIKRYMLFHNKRHPHEMASADIAAFLTHVAVQQNVAASTQNQALSTLLFLSRDALKTPRDFSLDAVRAKKPKCLPTS